MSTKKDKTFKSGVLKNTCIIVWLCKGINFRGLHQKCRVSCHDKKEHKLVVPLFFVRKCTDKMKRGKYKRKEETTPFGCRYRYRGNKLDSLSVHNHNFTTNATVKHQTPGHGILEMRHHFVGVVHQLVVCFHGE